MSSPLFYNYPGVGTTNSEAFHYTQAVRVGNVVKCSGQGGWDSAGVVDPIVKAQVIKATENVTKALKSVAETLEWGNVYAVRSYHTNMEETFDLLTDEFKRLMPGRRPVWTCVEVTKLGIPGMVVEVEVEALIEREEWSEYSGTGQVNAIKKICFCSKYKVPS